MTPQEREAMEMAFNALLPNGTTYGRAALKALRDALEAPEPAVVSPEFNLQAIAEFGELQGGDFESEKI